MACGHALRRTVTAKQAEQNDAAESSAVADPVASGRLDRRRWAMLIQRVYQADPLLCPKCGGTIKIIAFIEARQGQLVRQILEHCGLWNDQPTPTELPPRSPPRPRRRSRDAEPCSFMPEADAGVSYEVDPDYLEHARREALDEQDQPDLPWDA